MENQDYYYGQFLSDPGLGRSSQSSTSYAEPEPQKKLTRREVLTASIEKMRLNPTSTASAKAVFPTHFPRENDTACCSEIVSAAGAAPNGAQIPYSMGQVVEGITSKAGNLTMAEDDKESASRLESHRCPIDQANLPKVDRMSNPVGWLQELCVAQKWPVPTYIMQQVRNNGSFRVVECHLLEMKQFGMGKTNKLAKHDAALNMSNLMQTIDKKDLPTSNSVIIASIGTDFIQVLQAVALKNNIKLVYTDLETSASSDMHRCILEVLCSPLVVVFGTGSTKKSARNTAALNALECLKITTKM